MGRGKFFWIECQAPDGKEIVKSSLPLSPLSGPFCSCPSSPYIDETQTHSITRQHCCEKTFPVCSTPSECSAHGPEPGACLHSCGVWKPHKSPCLTALALSGQMPLAAESVLLMCPSSRFWRPILDPSGRGWKGQGRSCFASHCPYGHHRSSALTRGRTKRGARVAGGTWNMLAPYGVRQALRRLSFPVLTNHLPAGERQRKVWL